MRGYSGSSIDQLALPVNLRTLRPHAKRITYAVLLIAQHMVPVNRIA
ncbi:hypothetical protein [Blastopirellula marina]|nr:hypothetical protein [Blastopirellula marina]